MFISLNQTSGVVAAFVVDAAAAFATGASVRPFGPFIIIECIWILMKI